MSERNVLAKQVAERIDDMPVGSEYSVRCDGTTVNLCIYPNRGNENSCRVAVQKPGEMLRRGDLNITIFQCIVYSVSFEKEKDVEVELNNKFDGVDEGQELMFLSRLLENGKWRFLQFTSS